MKQELAYAHIHQPRLFTDQDIAAGVGRNLVQLETTYLSAVKEAGAIHNSKDLTVTGKTKSLQELESKVALELNQWRSTIKYEKMMEQIEEEMTPTKSQPDDFVAELRMREIRDHIKTLDPLDQEGAYREAAETGDDLFLQAIERSPIPFTFATQELVDKIKFTRLSRQYPQQAQKLRDLTRAKEQVDSALKSVHTELRKQKLNVSASDGSRAQAA